MIIGEKPITGKELTAKVKGIIIDRNIGKKYIKRIIIKATIKPIVKPARALNNVILNSEKINTPSLIYDSNIVFGVGIKASRLVSPFFIMPMLK